MVVDRWVSTGKMRGENERQGGVPKPKEFLKSLENKQKAVKRKRKTRGKEEKSKTKLRERKGKEKRKKKPILYPKSKPKPNLYY